MTDIASELNEILQLFASRCGAGSSFSERVQAMTQAREEITKLFNQEATEEER